jgi:hypothetical protein
MSPAGEARRCRFGGALFKAEPLTLVRPRTTDRAVPVLV